MRDWIVGLEKAATERQPGVDPAELGDVEAQLGLSAPEELRDLYRQLNGASFAVGVRLFPLVGDRSVVSESRAAPGTWQFGEKDQDQRLFAARRADIEALGAKTPPPDWIETVDATTWLYGWRNLENSESRVYRTLERLLATLIPPAQTEEFGDITYARAINAVQGALDSIGGKEALLEGIGEELGELDAALSRKATKSKPAKKALKKPARKPKARSKPAPRRKAAAPKRGKPGRSTRKAKSNSSRPKPKKATRVKSAPKRPTKKTTKRR